MVTLSIKIQAELSNLNAMNEQWNVTALLPFTHFLQFKYLKSPEIFARLFQVSKILTACHVLQKRNQVKMQDAAEIPGRLLMNAWLQCYINLDSAIWDCIILFKVK